MNDLSPEARRLLQMTRGESPPSGDKERLRKLIALRMEPPSDQPEPPPPAPSPSSPPSPSPPASPGGAGLLAGGSLLKASAVVGVVASGALVTWLATSTPSAPPAAVVLAPLSAPSSSVAPTLPAPEPVREPVAEPATTSVASAASSSPAVPASTPRASASAAVDTLQAELLLLGQAKEALARGDLGAAREALAQHQQQHARGLLATERTVLSFLVACRGGQAASVRPQVRAFLARTPRSPYAVPLRTACGELDEP